MLHSLEVILHFQIKHMYRVFASYETLLWLCMLPGVKNIYKNVHSDENDENQALSLSTNWAVGTQVYIYQFVECRLILSKAIPLACYEKNWNAFNLELKIPISALHHASWSIKMGEPGLLLRF